MLSRRRERGESASGLLCEVVNCYQFHSAQYSAETPILLNVFKVPCMNCFLCNSCCSVNSAKWGDGGPLQTQNGPVYFIEKPGARPYSGT